MRRAVYVRHAVQFMRADAPVPDADAVTYGCLRRARRAHRICPPLTQFADRICAVQFDTVSDG